MLRELAPGRHARALGITTVPVLVVVAALLLAVSVVALLSRREAEIARTAAAAAPVPVGAAPGAGMPVVAAKARPASPGFRGCPPDGDGGDPALNRLKNRADTAAWLPVSFDAVLTLPWPPGVQGRARRTWRGPDAAQVARYEGLPVSVEGVVLSATQAGPESTNCHGADPAFRDWHIRLARGPGEDRGRSIVIETTPVVRAMHPEWTLAGLRALARSRTPVRINGWLMLDPEHPDQVGRSRGTIWEIHPVMGIDVQQGRQWVRLARRARR